MSNSVRSALAHYFERWLARCEQQGSFAWQEYDGNWRSPCQWGDVKDGRIQWRPSLRATPANFSNIEHALEIRLHPDIIDFYRDYYAASIPAFYKGLAIELCQAWNDADLERLQENIIGHLLMLRRFKRTPTLFFACCRDEKRLLSLDNATGEVLLEHLGSGKRTELGVSLSEFIDRLEP